MKKSKIYLIILLLFAGATGFIVLKFDSNEKKRSAMIYTLQDRPGKAETPEWTLTKQTAGKLIEAIHANPHDNKSLLALASVFLREARITGNYMYYDMAALKYVNDVLKNDSANFEALTLQSLIFLSQHHFADGLAIAEKAQRINQYNAFVYGILVDGNVEMGHYDAAVENADKMVAIRPDIRSYSRISYLREIYGDYTGAIKAMKLAVDAGAPGDETTEWCRVQEGKLYELTGDLKTAENLYTTALDSRPDYAYALAGLARIAKAHKDYSNAIALYVKADSLTVGYSCKEELVDVYRHAGQKEKATALNEEVISSMLKDAESGTADQSIGHYGDQELAYAYLKADNYEKALYHALQEYNRRPDNIDVNETLAWVYYKKGDYAKALPYIKVALKTHSKNPRLLCRAAWIFHQNSDASSAWAFLQEVLKSNPNFDISLNGEVTFNM